MVMHLGQIDATRISKRTVSLFPSVSRPRLSLSKESTQTGPKEDWTIRSDGGRLAAGIGVEAAENAEGLSPCHGGLAPWSDGYDAVDRAMNDRLGPNNQRYLSLRVPQ